VLSAVTTFSACLRRQVVYLVCGCMLSVCVCACLMYLSMGCLFCVLFVCKCVLYYCHRMAAPNAVNKYIDININISNILTRQAVYL